MEMSGIDARGKAMAEQVIEKLRKSKAKQRAVLHSNGKAHRSIATRRKAMEWQVND